MSGGVKKALAVVLLASTAVATGVIVRSGTARRGEQSTSRPENAALLTRYELPALHPETPGATKGDALTSRANQTELLAQSLAKEILKRNPNGPELLNDLPAITLPSEDALNRIIDERVAQFDPAS